MNPMQSPNVGPGGKNFRNKQDIDVLCVGGVIVEINRPRGAKWKLERFMDVYVDELGNCWTFKKLRRNYPCIGRIVEILENNECVIGLRNDYD